MSASGTARVALLVDGENVSSGYAGKLLTEAAQHGCVTIKRVYGNAARVPGWDAAPGLRLVHAGQGKNAADLLLTIEAMQIFHDAQADVFVIASSDGDFSHLATHLRERGVSVIGAGEGKAPETFRKSCSHWVRIEAKPTEIDKAIEHVFSVIPDGLSIGQVNPEIRKRHAITLADVAEKSWRKYFEARPKLYAITGAGPQTRISLR